MQKRRSDSRPIIRITDLDRESYISKSRDEPRYNNKERELIALARSGATVEQLTSRCSLHPEYLFRLCGLDMDTPEFGAALARWHHLYRNVIERDD
jgi:hypothetical protein